MFPRNPTNGAVIELEGVRYQYDGSLRSWNRLEGAVKVVTIYQSGLMTKEEYNKLARLILPPPRTTIRGEQCVTPFVGGAINLTSTDNFLVIRGDVDIHTKEEVTSYEFRIHENTVGFNFDVNVQDLVQYLVDNGQIRFIAKPGPKGLTGITGPDGDDGPLAGPQGLAGRDGIAEYNLGISADPLSYNNTCSNQRKVITKIVPDGEFGRLLVYRSILGNANAAPDRVNAGICAGGAGLSTWVVALPQSALTAPSQVYYLDIQPIIDAFNDKYQSELLRIKAGYENVVNFWLSKMATLFDTQKLALCCALNRCLSNAKNQDTRRYLESQRIQALQADTTASFIFPPDESCTSAQQYLG